MSHPGAVSAKMGTRFLPERDQSGVRARTNRIIRMREDEEYRLEQLRKAAINGGSHGRGRRKVPVSLPKLKCLESEG